MSGEHKRHEVVPIQVWAERIYKAMREIGHDPWPADELAKNIMRICKPSCLKCNPPEDAQ